MKTYQPNNHVLTLICSLHKIVYSRSIINRFYSDSNKRHTRAGNSSKSDCGGSDSSKRDSRGSDSRTNTSLRRQRNCWTVMCLVGELTVRNCLHRLNITSTHRTQNWETLTTPFKYNFENIHYRQFIIGKLKRKDYNSFFAFPGTLSLMIVSLPHYLNCQ